VGDAAVDDRPALARPVRAVEPVAQQPQVDVVEREGQAHAQPAQAGRQLERVPGRRQRVAERVVQLLFEGVHGGGAGC